MKKISWLALLLLGTANSAHAQTGSRPETFGAAPRINASAAPARQLGIRAGLDTSYDSNVFGISGQRQPGQQADDRSKSDIQITPSLQVDLLLPFGRQSAFLRGQLGYDFYLKNSDLNRERINLQGGANLRLLGTCSSEVTAGYGRFRSNTANVFVQEPGGELDVNNTEENKSIGIQTQCGGAIGLSPSFGYRHDEIRNSGDFYKANDSNRDSFDASIGYQRPTLGRIAIYGSYTDAEYLNRDIFGLPRGFAFPPFFSFDPNRLDGVTSYSAGVRYERSIGSRLSAAVSGGYSWVNPKALSGQKFRGSSYSVNVTVQPTDRLTLDLLASRSAELSNTVFSSFSVTDIYSLNGTYRINPKLSANFGASQQKRDYRGGGVTPDRVAQIGQDKFTRAYAGLAYDLNRRLRVNGLFSQQQRKTDDGRFNFSNTTVSLGVSLALGR